jgi:hypothetical protein
MSASNPKRGPELTVDIRRNGQPYRALLGQEAYAILVSLIRMARSTNANANGDMKLVRGQRLSITAANGATWELVSNYDIVVRGNKLMLNHPDGDCGCQHRPTQFAES